MGGPRQEAASARAAAVRIVRTLREVGHVAYFAGGCVRDELLGLVPADYDVATDATPGRVSALFPRTAQVGAHFGVVLVKAGGPVVEVATFRSDGAYSDRRRPDEVTFSDAESDARRRDFTVNALFLDPLKEGGGGGEVVDYVGGVTDLRSRVLRAVGDPEARLAEDHLRALRAVRLAARLGFEIEGGTAAAIRQHARELAGVSPERVGDEMRRVLGHPSRGVGVGLLQDLGLDGPVLGSERRAVPRRVGGLSAGVGIGVCLAAMAMDRGEVDGPGAIQGLMTRWRRTMCLSNEEREAGRAVLESYFSLRQEFTGMSVAGQKRAAVGAGFAGAVEILSVEEPEAATAVLRRVAELTRTEGGLAPAALVTGDDLIAAGMRPGPGFARLLWALYDEQLEGKFGNSTDGLKRAEAMRAGFGL